MNSKLLAAVSAAALCTAAMPAPVAANAANGGTMRNMSTMDIVKDMGIGINLGNTFESCGDWIAQWGDGTPNSYETAWGSPTITEATIKGYADEGFGVLRVPVAWSNLMSSDGNYTISDAYKARVRQVIDWALEDDMYVIVNLHWDGGWLENLPSQHDEVMKKYSAIWQQLSEEFKDYGDKLMFEAQNEELGNWKVDENQCYTYTNEVNQTFVNIVRNSGGNNEQRHLLISGYNTDITKTCDSRFVMPDDPAGRCALSVHYYTPSPFAILEEDASWAKNRTTWGTDSDIAELNRYFDMLANTYSSKGVPVIIGEYGCPRKGKELESVQKYLSSVCEAALSREGICPVLWDTTDLHYDRKTGKMTDQTLHDQFIALRDKYRPAEPFTPAPVIGDVNGDSTVNSADLVVLSKYLLGCESINDPQVCDVDQDGKINVFDFVALREIVASVNQ